LVLAPGEPHAVGKRRKIPVPQDEEVLTWLMTVTAYAIQLHHSLKPGMPAEMRTTGPTIEEQRATREAFEEGFARWMGWRGDNAQQQEMADWGERRGGWQKKKPKTT
jgi:hypothetical protein